MGMNRVFLPQETLDTWMTDGRIEVAGDTMTLSPEGQRFTLKTAVRFIADLAGGGDQLSLIGKVKDLEQLVALGGDHCADSVVLGDDAYQVVEGFVGEPIFDEDESQVSGASLADAARAAAGDDPQSGEIDLLARFFLSSS